MSDNHPEHEPIVSETLERNAERNREQAQRTQPTTDKIAATRDQLRSEDREPADSPADARSAELDDGEGRSELKRHGDALEHGTGNRHGVHDADQRPDTCT